MKISRKIAEQTRRDESLYEAVRQKNLPLAQSALLSGANPNAITQGGLPLVAACALGDIDCVKLLLNAKADTNLADDRGENALTLAARKDHADIIHLLAQAGAVIDSADINGCTALHHAATLEALASITALVELKADINKKDLLKMTPLAYAARKGNEAAVALLLAAGASVDIEDDWSSTALTRACKNGHSGVARMLLVAGANPNVRNAECLQSAIDHNDKELFTLLLQHGADTGAIDGKKHPKFRKLIDAEHQQKTHDAKNDRSNALDKISHQGLPTRTKIQKPIKLKPKGMPKP